MTQPAAGQSQVREAVAAFASSGRFTPSTNILLFDRMPKDCDSVHRSKYLATEPGEQVLLLLNKGPLAFFGVPLNMFSGIALTTTRLHYCTIKNSIFAGVVPSRGQMGAIPLAQLQSVRIGEHDTSYGTAYVGHELVINGQPRGLVRMGTGIQYDDDAIVFLNELFELLKATRIVGQT